MRWYWSTMDPEYNVTDVLTKRGSLEADTHGECTHVKTTVMLPQPRNCQERPSLPVIDPPLAHQGNRALPTPQSCTSSLQNFGISVV